MHAHSSMLWLRRILVLFTLALGASSCVHALVGDADVCEVGKEGYAVGEKYQDDCNTCVCQEDGTSSCTELDCEPYDSDDAGVTAPKPIDAGATPPTAGCTFQGKVVSFGERIFTGNKCESCTCEISGKLNCNGYECPEDGGAPICSEGKYTYAVGTFISDDGCKCDCRKDGKIDCYGCGGGYDAGPGYPVDAAVPSPLCKYNGSVVSGTFFSGGGCNTCTCQSNGEVYCTMNACQTDGGAGYCELNGTFYVVGAPVPSSNGCNNCACIADQKIWCDTQVCPEAGTTPNPPGTCGYGDATYKVGETFVGKDKCGKCTCIKPEYVECSGCMPRQCYLGGVTFQTEQQVTCPDGCNTCACQSDGDWSMTKQACSALPPVTACPADVSVSVFLAQLIYLETNSIAVPDARCVNGKTRDFQLCYEADAIIGSYSMYVYSTGAERACNGTTNERVFSLLPLQDAITAAHPDWRKATLRGNGITLGYGF